MDSVETQNVLLSCLFYAMNETVFSKDGHMAQPLNIEKIALVILSKEKEMLLRTLNLN